MSVGAWVWGLECIASVLTLLFGRPWTALLSGRRYGEEVRAHPYFTEANMWITGAWTLYFALAASVTVLTAPWVALVFVGPTPLLGLASFKVGDRYASWRMRRTTRTSQIEARTGGAEVMATAAQQELRAMISDKSDSEIMALLSKVSGGAPAMLDQTITGMAETFDPDSAIDCVIGYEIDAGGDPLTYRVEVRGHDVVAAPGPLDDARVVLHLKAPEYLRLITGLLDGTDGFMSGRMRITGDVMFAPQIPRIFRPL
jgi:putative sterol carrier protein